MLKKQIDKNQVIDYICAPFSINSSLTVFFFTIFYDVLPSILLAGPTVWPLLLTNLLL